MSNLKRWETIQKLKLRARDMAAGEVQKVDHAIQVVNDLLEQLLGKQAENQNQRTKPKGALDVSDVLSAQRYSSVLQIQFSNAQDSLRKLEAEKQRAQAGLMKAQQELEAIEKLRSKAIEAENLEALRKQQFEIDELTQVRYAKKG